MTDVKALDQAKQRAVSWLIGRIQPDGSLRPVEHCIHYYRVPWALAVAGRSAEGARCLDWVCRNMLDEQGDIAAAKRSGSAFETLWYGYPNTNWLMGAVLLQRWDAIRHLAGFLEGLQDGDSGGTLNGRGPVADQQPMDLLTACQTGMSLLAAGRANAAMQSGRFVTSLWEAQPDPNKLFFRYRAGQGVVTDIGGVPDAEHILYVVDAQAEKQLFYMPGVAAACLGRLYQATGDGAWLETAIQYQRFAMNQTEKQFDVPQVCKTGWGASVLYQITREADYRDWALRVGQYYIDTQRDDGSWTAPGHEDAEHITTEVVAEFIIHLDTTLGCLASA